MNTDKIKANLQCIGNTILSLKFENQMVSLHDTEETKKTIEVSHELDEMKHLEDEKCKIGTVNLYIKAVIEEDGKQIQLEMAIQGCFVVDDSISDSEFKILLTQNGLASIYSYSRAIVASFSAQALNDGKILLPMINVVKYSRETKAEEMVE